MKFGRTIFLPPTKETVILYLNYLLPSMLIMVYLTVVWQRSEIFFLNRYSSKSELGFYNIGFTIYAIFAELGWSLINGYYPRLSHMFGSQDWDQIKHEFSHAFVFISMYALPICLGGIVTIGALIPLIYGQKMLPAVLPARILYLGMVPAVVTSILNIALSTLGGVWVLAFSGLAGSIFNILMDLLFIPRYGAIGAAMANTASQCVVFLLLLALVNIKFHLMIPWKHITRLILYGLAATFFLPTLILHAINIPWLGLVFAVVLSAIGYISLLLFSKTFSHYLPRGDYISRKSVTMD